MELQLPIPVSSIPLISIPSSIFSVVHLHLLDPRHPLPPQLFNDQEYCGDYDQFELANECDSLEVFLKLSPEEIPQLNKNTLDTSKIDENHPNGKVIEDEKPDDDKENKTEEENQV